MALEDINLSDFEFWLQPEAWRDGAFRTLRDESPVHWCEGYEAVEGGFPIDGRGYWSLTRYDDVWHASRNPQLFCSGRGGVNIGDMPQEIAEFFGSMIAMDDPKHARLRSIVQKGFTPKTDQPGRGLRAHQGGDDRRRPDRAVSPTASATSSSRSQLPCRCRSSAR